ncbi:MAG: alpha,alpha-phosphotrehalase [Brevinema sp.]
MLKKDWWKRSTIYQIYPKSFCDSNGDGIGDIKGIISKLGYLHDLGVDVIWITPMYVSPMNDNGYDIADYYHIDKTFGTMEDFEELLTQIHRRGMKLIMDMVINHTSTAHHWFQEALKDTENKYHNYYIWKDGILDNPPNNWMSKFGGSSWKYIDHLKKYYLHLFDKTQADLNWENKEMREDIYKMIRFWLDKGIDGFRLDVINLLSKNQDFPDDTYLTATDDGRKFYTDGPKIHEYLKELRINTFGKYPDSLTVGEMSSTTIPHCIEYTKPESKELSMIFSFHHLKVDYINGSKWTLGTIDFQALKNILFEWQVEMEKGGGWNALFWCNHDQPRIVSRFGNEKYLTESAKMLGTVIHMMRGTPYIYQGEEIAMTNPHFNDVNQYRDVEALNHYQIMLDKNTSPEDALRILDEKSRDSSRTPMQWDASKHAGFTTTEPWIKVSSNYPQINVQQALKDSHSVFYHYQKLIMLRKSYKVIAEGRFIPLYQNDPQILGYLRALEEEKLLVLNNFSEHEYEIQIPEELASQKGEILINNYENLLLNNSTIKLRAYESLVLLYKI